MVVAFWHFLAPWLLSGHTPGLRLTCPLSVLATTSLASSPSSTGIPVKTRLRETLFRELIHRDRCGTIAPPLISAHKVHAPSMPRPLTGRGKEPRLSPVAGGG